MDQFLYPHKNTMSLLALEVLHSLYSAIVLACGGGEEGEEGHACNRKDEVRLDKMVIVKADMR